VDHRQVSETLKAIRVAPLEAIPGLVHGFEERLGPAGWETREGSRRRVALALADRGRLFLLQQVHGTVVREAPWEADAQGDAGMAGGPGLIVGVETADCLPILLVDPVRRVAAAVHAGWRGTAAGIAGQCVLALVRAGSRADTLVAALGPGIGVCCYEVGEELREAFGAGSEAFFPTGPTGRSHLDVRAANVTQLLKAGLPASQIHHVEDCTFCRADRYHSFRREGAGAGRMISYIGWVP
jgi:YfiH family protein